MQRQALQLAVAAALGGGLPGVAAAQLFPAEFEVSSIDGRNGFVMYGEAGAHRSGYSVSAAGDVNGDGIDDLIIGAFGARPNGNAFAGRSYVVFGSDIRLAHPFQLRNLVGVNGFVVNGEAPMDYSGRTVSAAGDINGDGIADLVIGARHAGPNGERSGRAYVVFGSNTGLPHPFDLSTLDGSNGFAINGEAADDRLGYSVAAAGDINGDGVDDLIVGAPGSGAGANGEGSGRSYLVFGSRSGFASPIEVGQLNVLALDGASLFEDSGTSVAAAGDVNGDGIDDLIIGAPDARPNGGISGRSYVVFGAPAETFGALDLGRLNGSNGFQINGEAVGDRSGVSVSRAGDVNGDGIDDLIIGAIGADPNGVGSGRAYVVFGTSAGFPSPLELGSLDGINGFVLNGEAERDRAGISVSGAGDINGDGIDDFIVGADRAARDDDSSGRSYVVFGTRSGFPHPFELSALNGRNGFKINTEYRVRRLGVSVSAAGDINGDGFDDLIVGAPLGLSYGHLNAGTNYVIFGRDTLFSDGFEIE